MSHTEETIWSQAVLELCRHGNEVTTFGVVSTINDIVAHFRRGMLGMGKSLLVVVAVEDCAIDLTSGHQVRASYVEEIRTSSYVAWGSRSFLQHHAS